MNRPIHSILIVLFLLACTVQTQGQQSSRSGARSDRYQRQRTGAVPLDRQTDARYAPNRARVGGYRTRGLSSSLYLGPTSNYTSSVVRSLQQKNAYLDPMTSWYGTSPYSTSLSGTSSIIRQRKAMLDPNPSRLTSPSGLNTDSTYKLRLWRQAPMVPQYDPRYQRTVKQETNFSQLGGTTLRRPGGYVRRGTGELITGQINERLLRSSLFRGARPATSEELAQFGEYVGQQGSQRGTKTTKPMIRPIGKPIGGEITDKSDQGISQGNLSRLMTNDRRELTGGSWATSGNVFSRMRGVSGRMIEPLGESLGEQAAVKTGLSKIKSSEPQLTSSQGGAKQTVPAEVLRTFVGTEQSQVNKFLAEAEELLKAGQYYRAANVYDLARAVDMDNPLPLLGRAMTLLAAGEYMTSINSLFQAIELFDSLAHFKIDINAFMVDLTVLDKRRAYLERRLEKYDDFRLRFLLGFAEYYSGMEKLGLRNLTKAVEHVPEEFSNVRQFVKTLELYQSIPE